MSNTLISWIVFLAAFWITFVFLYLCFWLMGIVFSPNQFLGMILLDTAIMVVYRLVKEAK